MCDVIAASLNVVLHCLGSPMTASANVFMASFGAPVEFFSCFIVANNFVCHSYAGK